MLDTNICSYIMREQPFALTEKLQQCVLRRERIVVSAITYAEMRFGAIGKKSSLRHVKLVDAFCCRLDSVLAWDKAAIDATTEIKISLANIGMPIVPNDAAIAGHALTTGSILVTNNLKEFERVSGLNPINWI